jgi:hypothetical protein
LAAPEVARFARKEKISPAALLETLDRAEKGLIDADLGGGAIKQRIARPGAGKSGGYRSVVLYSKGERAFFVFGLSKSVQDNIRDDEQEQFKKPGGPALRLLTAIQKKGLEAIS